MSDMFCGFCPDGLTTMDGFDDCIIGIVEQAGRPPVVCYDTEKIVEKHMESGMTYEEAHEFFNFNQLGAYVGDTTPCFLTRRDDDS